MAQQTIGLGAAPNDGNGDDLRAGGDKINDNFTELYTPACFKAHKNASDQTGVADNTATQVTFGTEVYDIGGFYASNAWTPPAGKIRLTASVLVSGTTVGSIGAIFIQKDGADLTQSNFQTPNGGGTLFVTVDDVCTGSNAYTVKASLDVSAGTVTFSGLVRCTYFSGHWFSA